MAGISAPDPRTIPSWEQAFQKYGIPEVRVVEQKARGNIKENQERLRTLVGTSYRDLLGTARTIIDTNEQMQLVENLLVNIGKRSDSRLVDKIASNFATLQASYNAESNPRFTLASHLSVLQHSLSAVSRLLRSRGSPLLAGKLWILARLTHQFLSSKPDVPPVVHALGKRLDTLRERLRLHLDHELVSSSKDVLECAQCLAALSIVTSSTPTDVLRYFQRLRLTALKSPSSEDGTKLKANILGRLRLFLGTLRGSRSIFPDALSSLLKVLGSKPLLEDELLTSTEELNLDVHQQWLTDDIKNFRPWTRYDELSKAKAQTMLKSWAGEALVAMVEGMKMDLDLETNVKTILDIRKEVLQEWLSLRSSRFSGTSSTEVLNKLRTCFLERIESIIHSAFAALKNGVCQSTEDVLSSWNEKPTTSGNQPATIWDPALISMEYENGAGAFKDAVINGFTGREERIRQVIASYGQGLEKVDLIKNEIQAMKNEHWEDTDDFDEDYDEVDNDEIEPSVVNVLSKSDPEKLRSTIDDSASRNISEMEKTLTSLLMSSPSNLDCSNSSARGIFVLRIVRELRKRIAQLSPAASLNNNAVICSEAIDKTHSNLARATFEQSEHVLTNSFEDFVKFKIVIKRLWDGHDPALPVNPTSANFKYFRALSRDMEQLGPDVWSPPAVRRLKMILSTFMKESIERIVKRLEDAQETRHSSIVEKGEETKQAEQSEGKQEVATTNDESEPDSNQEKNESVHENGRSSPDVVSGNQAGDQSPDQTSDKLIQLVFDALYLQHFLGSKEDVTDWSEIISKLQQKTELSEAAMARLRKSAGDYWRRTYLLFGLLCAPDT